MAFPKTEESRGALTKVSTAACSNHHQGETIMSHNTLTTAVPAGFTPGMRVWSRSFGAGTVSALEPSHPDVVQVRFDSGLEPLVRVEKLFTAFPPTGEGWEPVPDSDPRDVGTYSGPVLTAARAIVAQEWSPEDGVTYWISGEPFFTLDDLRDLAGLLNGLLKDIEEQR